MGRRAMNAGGAGWRAAEVGEQRRQQWSGGRWEKELKQTDGVCPRSIPRVNNQRKNNHRSRLRRCGAV
jgi:hypothetical protein